MKERIIGIDILKFFAVFLIINSHMGSMYVNFHELATGGTIGNLLFFFCSGFTLFLKPFESVKAFPNWYKKRIIRIYPAVLAVAIVTCLFFGNNLNIVDIIICGGQWFVPAIMVMYVFIYFVGLFARERVGWVIAIISLAVIIWFYLMDRPFPFGMFGNESCNIRWLLYFLFMFFGAWMGLHSAEHKSMAGRQWLNLILALLCIVAFYVISGLTDRYRSVEYLHVFCFIPLLLGIYFLYWWCEGNFAKSIYNSKVGHFIIRFIGGLCLEIYLIQNWLITDKLNNLFPLNILIIFIVVVISAYLCRILARLILQTFRAAPYDWKQMVSAF